MPELHFTKSGSGPALLILHGLFGSGKNWHSHMRRFAEDFQVFSIDLRNHGQSFHRDEMTYPAMAEDVAQLIARLGLRDCRILGHSMGGKVAMTLALQHPAVPKAYPLQPRRRAPAPVLRQVLLRSCHHPLRCLARRLAT